MVVDPQFGLDPEKWAREMLKAQRLDPDAFARDEEEGEIPAEIQQYIQELEARVQELEGDEAKERIKAEAHLQGKQIDADARLQAKAMDVQLARQKAELEAQRDQAKADMQARIAHMKAQLDQVETRIKDDQNAIRVAQLRLQRRALESQIARANEELAAKVNQGALHQVIHNDRYGKIPHALG